MPTASLTTVLTPRDIELLTWLYRCPLTVEQLLKLSQTFAIPFQSDSRVRGRLARLRDAGWVRRFRYATAQRGTPADYYKLTLAGYRLLQGEWAMSPTKRFFDELKIARHHHTQALSDFLVHTAASAKAAKLQISDIVPENTLRLELNAESLFPDGTFRLTDQAGVHFNFCIELDCGTEPLRSASDRESIVRKIRFYDRYQDTAEERFRVLFVVTRSSERLTRILETAASVTRNPRRSLCYGILLADFLAEPHAVSIPCFRNHRQESVPLVPMASARVMEPQTRPGSMASEVVMPQ